MSLVYLAGPITGLSFGSATDWRDYATKQLEYDSDIRCLSPLRCKDYLLNTTKIEDSYESIVLSSQKGITTRDRWDCTRADVVLVNFVGSQKASIGSVMEVAWADSVRTPIVIALESGNVHDHAMVREAAGYILPTLDEAIEVVRAIV